ncbi:MAG: glycosyltransferase [Salibacteraceae bacterium]
MYISPGFARDVDDGYCMPYFQNLLTALHRKHPKLRVSVIALQYPYHDQPYQWKHVDVYPCGGNNTGFPSRLRTWWKAERYFRQLHKKQPVDLIHSFWLSECAMLGNRWAKKNRIPHLVNLMGQDVLPTNRYLKWVDRQYPRLVAVSEFQAEMFQKTTGERVSATIPHGNDLPQEDHAYQQERDIDILGVGSLIPLKQYDWLVGAVAEVVKTHPKLKVVILGEGPEEEPLRAQARSLGIEKTLTVKGWVPRSEVLNYLGRSRILAHPSRYEAYGFVFAEALWQGATVVSQKVGTARALPKWHLVDDQRQFTQKLLEVLSTDMDISRVSLDSANEIAFHYWEQYSQA